MGEYNATRVGLYVICGLFAQHGFELNTACLHLKLVYAFIEQFWENAARSMSGTSALSPDLLFRTVCCTLSVFCSHRF